MCPCLRFMLNDWLHVRIINFRIIIIIIIQSALKLKCTNAWMERDWLSRQQCDSTEHSDCKSLHLASQLPSSEAVGRWCGTAWLAASPGGGAGWAEGIGALLCAGEVWCGAEPTAALLITGCDDCCTHHCIYFTSSVCTYMPSVLWHC